MFDRGTRRDNLINNMIGAHRALDYMRPPGTEVFASGKFSYRLLGPDGEPVSDLIEIPNGATTAGLNYLLGAGFQGNSQTSTWYVGLINASGFTGLSANDTMSSHAGWTEYTAFSGATTARQTWTTGAASGGSIINGTAMSFTNGATTGSIQGMFLASSSAFGATTGTLWATAAPTPISLPGGQTFQVYYQISLTPSS